MRRRGGCGGPCTRAGPRARDPTWSTTPAAASRSCPPATRPNQGLVRICTFPVPTYLLSGGKATSWECVVEARLGEYSRYVAVGKPLWSRAEGWHRLEEQPDGRTRLTFHETYHARNPMLRAVFEKRVHRFISERNEHAYTELLGRLGPVELVVA